MEKPCLFCCSSPSSALLEPFVNDFPLSASAGCVAAASLGSLVLVASSNSTNVNKSDQQWTLFFFSIHFYSDFSQSAVGPNLFGPTFALHAS